VFGLTHSPGAAGVFGANNSSQGVGVQGNGPEAGINGFSDGGAGVRGHSNHGAGVEGFAHAPEQNAIFGLNDARGAVPAGLNRPAGGGVWGHTKVEAGSGVIGSVEPGLGETTAGVTGIGRTAGRFLGNVEIVGTLLVNGERLAASDVSTLLGQMRLLQAEVSSLTGQVTGLQGQVLSLQAEVASLRSRF
jgi:hypothetical protein